MKKHLALGAVLALGLPGAALAADDQPTAKESASAACKTERTKVGDAAFRMTYGTNKNGKNAFGKCVSKRSTEAKAAETTAKNTCKAEQEADQAKFEQTYGTNKNKKNAYGKCVSAQTKTEMKEETEDRVSASKACKTERSADKAKFEQKYGTNKNKKNAFGKCVSAQAKAQGDDDKADEPKTGDDAPSGTPETGTTTQS